MNTQSTVLHAFIQELRQKLDTHPVRMPMRGTSMSPTILPGQRVVVNKKSPQAIEPGDIALFVFDNRLVAHRIIYKEIVDGKTLFLTRGDNCETLDNWVIDADAILGIVELQAQN